MGTVVTTLLVIAIAVAVFFAFRSIRRGKSCGGGCAHCAGCPSRRKDS